MQGSRFGRWTVFRHCAIIGRWWCRCDCGTKKRVAARSLVSGRSKSCGCSKRGGSSGRKHGMSRSPTYFAWQGMKERCYNPRSKRYYDYGGRGIKVCDPWRHSFEAFLADMRPKPEGMTLDRIDTNGNYEPSNCRWATALQQGQNTRRNHLITIGGTTLILTEWARRMGLKQESIRNRLRRGWSEVDAVTTPVNPRYSHPKRESK